MTARRAWRWPGQRASPSWSRPSRCRSSPKQARASRRRRWRSPGAALGDQARGLEDELHERGGKRHAVLAPVEEVTDGEALGARVVELQDPLDLGPGRRAGGGPAPAAVEQPQHRIALLAGAPAPQAAGVNAEDSGRLQPRPGAG